MHAGLYAKYPRKPSVRVVWPDASVGPGESMEAVNQSSPKITTDLFEFRCTLSDGRWNGRRVGSMQSQHCSLKWAKCNRGVVYLRSVIGGIHLSTEYGKRQSVHRVLISTCEVPAFWFCMLGRFGAVTMSYRQVLRTGPEECWGNPDAGGVSNRPSMMWYVVAETIWWLQRAFWMPSPVLQHFHPKGTREIRDSLRREWAIDSDKGRLLIRAARSNEDAKTTR